MIQYRLASRDHNCGGPSLTAPSVLGCLFGLLVGWVFLKYTRISLLSCISDFSSVHINVRILGHFRSKDHMMKSF